MEKIKYYTERVNLKISDEEAINIGKRINEINDLILDWYWFLVITANASISAVSLLILTDIYCCKVSRK